jgi:hypothetical protein
MRRPGRTLATLAGQSPDSLSEVNSEQGQFAAWNERIAASIELAGVSPVRI